MNNTQIDLNKFKDMTIADIYKKRFPKLVIPMMQLTGPLWDVIKATGAKIAGGAAAPVSKKKK